MRKESLRKVKALADFCIKNKIDISGCGCCGSPWLIIDGESFENFSIRDGKIDKITKEEVKSLIKKRLWQA